MGDFLTSVMNGSFSNEITKHAFFDEMEKVGKELTIGRRKRIKKKNFAIPKGTGRKN